MTFKHVAALVAAFVATLMSVVANPSAQVAESQAVQLSRIPPGLRERAERKGTARVIVELRLPSGRHVPEGLLRDDLAIATQRRDFRNVADSVLARLRSRTSHVNRRYESVPYLALDVSQADLDVLDAAGSEVVRVFDDTIAKPLLGDTVPLIQADQVWQAGFDGSGTMIAVVDTGVDALHPFLSGRVVEEACFSSTVSGISTSTCPNGQDEQFGPGAAVPCTLSDCIHGTHVAGIAAGDGATAGQLFSGVARGARLMAIQVASVVIDDDSCGGSAPCSGAFSSDIIAALERVHTIGQSRNIVAVNMSLGSGSFNANCDDSPYKPSIDNLRAIGIASVVASGNGGSSSSTTSPACVSSAISVGSVSKSDTVSWFSDVAPFLTLLAPGESVVSSVPGAGFEALSGTSMAAPHVSGLWALIRQAVPSTSVSTIENALRETGRPVPDTRFFGSVTVPRVNALEALATLKTVVNPVPELSGLTPSAVRAGLGPLDITLSGEGFNAFSVARWNRQPVATRIVSTTQLTATLTPQNISQIGTGYLSVANPEPGGGISTELPLSIDPPPTLTVGVSTVAAGQSVTVTLRDGLGGSRDWLGLAPVGSSNQTSSQWVYVGTGLTTRTWTVNMPATAGAYEFRLLINGYERVATSQPITVDPSLNPSPVVASMSPSNAYAGSGPFTLTVNGSGFTQTSIVRWNGVDRQTTFVSGSQLRAAITATDLASAGTATVTVFNPSPGGGLSAGLAFSIMAAPILSVTPGIVPAGTLVTVSLTEGFGGSNDWLTLASTSAPNNSYLQWTYVGAGVTTRTWTVQMPSVSGTYEFRFFPAGGYIRAATSAPITVDASLNPSPAVTAISPATAFTGGGPFTLTVTGSGFRASSVVRWNGANRPTTFVSSSEVRAAIPGSDLTSPGVIDVTVFTPTPGGGTSAPRPFSINVGPSLSPNATVVPAGTSVTVTLANGFGGGSDWLALASTSAANNSYILWTYVGAGLSTRTWTVTMPSTSGPYEFRLFVNGGYTRVATSSPVTVDASLNPPPTLTNASPSSAYAGTGPLTLSVAGTGFTATSVVRWNGLDRPTTRVSSTQLTAVIGVQDLASPGTAEVTVFSPAPGGGVSTTRAFTILAAPTLAVNATTVAPGASATLTVTNGLGGSSDWLALAPIGAPNNSYLQWTYVGGGVTSRTWVVKMPLTPGTYEFRYFPNGGYTRAATAVVTVSSGS